MSGVLVVGWRVLSHLHRKGDLELNFAVNQASIYTLDYILKNIR